MKVFVIFHPKDGTRPEDFKPLAEPEDKHAFGLYRNDIVREMYSRTEGGGTIAVLECDDVEHARQLMADLPMVQAGMLDLRFFGAKPYRGITQLAD